MLFNFLEKRHCCILKGIQCSLLINCSNCRYYWFALCTYDKPAINSRFYLETITAICKYVNTFIYLKKIDTTIKPMRRSSQISCKNIYYLFIKYVTTSF